MHFISYIRHAKPFTRLLAYSWQISSTNSIQKSAEKSRPLPIVA